MLFLADESCDLCMTRILRAEGHDVMLVSDTHQGANDLTVINLALTLSRVLITEDKDFGQLVYASGQCHNGVILLRYSFQLRHQIADQLSALVKSRGESLAHAFSVIEPGRIRILSE
jgi:predicted nuclease of predicted toxin-antitoxin system